MDLGIDLVLKMGLDGIYVGPGDLALALGFREPASGQAEPDHAEAVRRVREACREHGIAAGVHCTAGKEAGQMRLWGEGRSGHGIGARSGATIPE